MKVGIVGAGAVGTACLMSVVALGFASEVVVVNRDRKRAKGVVTDLQYGAILEPYTVLRDGDYAALAGAAVVLITAGVNEKAGGATDRNDPAGRLRLLDSNVDAYRQIIPRVHEAAPESVIVVVTDPPDPLADVVRKLGHERVVSTGTYLDSLRFRFHIARRLHVSPAQVEAQVLGEHGTSAVFVWSSARVGGALLGEILATDDARRELESEVRFANITIIEGTGASALGIGVVSARIAEMIVRDENAVIPLGSWNPEYGVTLSVPTVLGRRGVVRRLPPDLSAAERQALEKSAETLRSAVARLRA
ncbi:MAG: lactate/malate family dehydrogenase [Myxococcaceae bacterium]